MTKAEETVGEQPLPSACATAQNATATCSRFESIGEAELSGRSRGASIATAAKSMQDCCSSCDGLEGCQAWMFESTHGRCRLIRFKEEPCEEEPGDLRCRCMTHSGTSFGFKPTSQIVWLSQPS